MSLRRWWQGGRVGQLRRSLRLLTTIETHLAACSQALTRLADVHAPTLPTNQPLPPDDASVAFSDPAEILATERWTTQFTSRYGRIPTDDELLTFLTEWTERRWLHTQQSSDRGIGR